MKNVFFGVMITLLLASCGSNQGYGGQTYVNQPNQQNASVTPSSSNIGDNLDLQALGELVRTSPNAEAIEKELNKKDGINNLDLDGDGKIDYIKVTEYGTAPAKGFSFTVDLANGEKQEVATVDLQQGNNNQATMNIQGNQNIYGNGAYYQSNYSMSDLVIMSWLFSYHTPYYSPWGYGHYPSYYGMGYGCSPYGSYHSRMVTTTKTSSITRTTRSSSSIKSPNAGLSSKRVSERQQSLSAPTRSQKSFSSTSNSRPSTSGFGNRGSSGSSRSSYSSPSRSSSSGSRSFGSSSRSSGGSRGGRR
jgi:hypothetical protein